MNYGNSWYFIEINCKGREWSDCFGNPMEKITLDKRYIKEGEGSHFSVKSFGELDRSFGSFPDSPVQQLTDWTVTIDSVFSSGNVSTVDLLYFLESINDNFNLIGCNACLYQTDGVGEPEPLFKCCVVSISSSNRNTSITFSERIGAPQIPAKSMPIFFGNFTDDEALYWPVEITTDELGREYIKLSESPLKTFEGLYIHSEKRKMYILAWFDEAIISSDKTRIDFMNKIPIRNIVEADLIKTENKDAFFIFDINRNVSSLLSEDERKNLIIGEKSNMETVQLWTDKVAISDNATSESNSIQHIQLGRINNKQKKHAAGDPIRKAVNVSKRFFKIFLVDYPESLFEGNPPGNSSTRRDNPLVYGNPYFFLQNCKSLKKEMDSRRYKYPTIEYNKKIGDKLEWQEGIYDSIRGFESVIEHNSHSFAGGVYGKQASLSLGFGSTCFFLKFPDIDLPSSATILDYRFKILYERVHKSAYKSLTENFHFTYRINDNISYIDHYSPVQSYISHFDLPYRVTDAIGEFFSETQEAILFVQVGNVITNSELQLFLKNTLPGFNETPQTSDYDYNNPFLRSYDKALEKLYLADQKEGHISKFVLYALELQRWIQIPFADAKLYAKGTPSYKETKQANGGNYVVPAIYALLEAAEVEDGFNKYKVEIEEEDGVGNTIVNSMLINEGADFREKLKTLAIASSTLIKFDNLENKFLVSSLERDQEVKFILISYKCLLEENGFCAFSMQTPMKDQIYSGLELSWGKDIITGKYKHKLLVKGQSIEHDEEIIVVPLTEEVLDWKNLRKQLVYNSNNGVRNLKRIENEWVRTREGAERAAYTHLCWCCAPLRRAQIKCVRTLLPADIETGKCLVDIGKFVKLYDLPGYPEKMHQTVWMVTAMTDDLDSFIVTINLLEAWNLEAKPSERYILTEDGNYINSEVENHHIKLEV